MLIPLKNMAGAQVGELELEGSVFAAPVHRALMHQALVRQLANARLGTHKTKSRGEVAGGGRKPWRQKGTGRARQGSTRASQWVGGGTVFGPQPRKYTQRLPKKMQRAALRSALTVKAAADQVIVLDALAMDKPHTKTMVGVLQALGVAEQRALIVMANKDEVVWRSANNLPGVKTILSGLINIRDLLGYDVLVFTQDAVEQVQTWLVVAGDEASAESSIEEAPMTSGAAETEE
jgi:large subunit ribosomal protein L4